MVKPKELIKALHLQLPFKRLFRNFFVTGNSWGMFHKSSCIKRDGNKKVKYNSIESAQKAAQAMGRKYRLNKYSAYKCVFCTGFHVGRNK